MIALAMATTGQAATHFDRGRTIHSKTKVPIKLDAHSLCNFKPKSATAELIRRASLMIFDEYTIGHKHLYETMDRSFRNLLESDKPYGGKGAFTYYVSIFLGFFDPPSPPDKHA